MATLTGKTIAATYTSLLKLEGDSGSTQAGASGNAVQVKTGDDDATPLYLNTNRIGIGTATPVNALQVNHSAADNDNGIMIVNEATTIADGALLGAIGFDGADGNVPSTVLESSCFIAAYAAEDHSTGDKGGDLSFGCSLINENQDVTSTRHMTILDSGNVGIGTAAPGSLLHIYKAASTETSPVEMLRLEIKEESSGVELGAGGGPAINFYVAEGSTTSELNGQIAVVREASADDDSAASMSFWTGANDSTGGTGVTEQMRITSAGNVGIGTAAPSALLTLSGEVAGCRIVRHDANDAIVNNDVLGRLEFAGTEDDHSNDYVGAKIEAASVETWVAGSQHGSQLRFFVTPENGTLNSTQSMTINDDGFVGIGTITPAELFHANEADTTAEAGVILRLSTTSGGAFKIGVNDKSASAPVWIIETGSNEDLNLNATGTGNVGIGTDTPGEKLQVGQDVSGANSYVEVSSNTDAVSGFVMSVNGTAKWALRNFTDDGLEIYDYGDSSIASHIDTTDNDWQAGSDLRIKKDINNINSVLDNVNSLRPITWKRKYGKADRIYPGLVAQEVLPHFPLVVSGVDKPFKEIPAKDAVLDDEGNVIEEATELTYEGGMSIGYSNFVPYLIKAVQELSAKVTALENA